ncbi:MAG: hypothetical protein WC792_00125 [Candidatus Micrarchaeia archaeon]|jgi:hypothetical protein
MATKKQSPKTIGRAGGQIGLYAFAAGAALSCLFGTAIKLPAELTAPILAALGIAAGVQAMGKEDASGYLIANLVLLWGASTIAAAAAALAAPYYFEPQSPAGQIAMAAYTISGNLALLVAPGAVLVALKKTHSTLKGE